MLFMVSSSMELSGNSTGTRESYSDSGANNQKSVVMAVVVIMVLIIPMGVV